MMVSFIFWPSLFFLNITAKKNCCSLLYFRYTCFLWELITSQFVPMYVKRYPSQTSSTDTCSDLGTTKIVLSLASKRCYLSPWSQRRSESDFCWHNYCKNLRCFTISCFPLLYFLMKVTTLSESGALIHVISICVSFLLPQKMFVCCPPITCPSSSSSLPISICVLVCLVWNKRWRDAVYFNEK